MRRVFDDLEDRLTAFIDPRDFVALLLDAGDDEAILVAKHAAVSFKLEEAGEDPWPPLPERVLDVEAHPVVRLRMVIRGLPDDSRTEAALEPVPRIMREPAGVSQSDLQRGLGHEARDPELPLPRRLPSLLLSAHVDSAHGREQAEGYHGAAQKLATLQRDGRTRLSA